MTFGKAQDNQLVIPSRLASHYHGMLRIQNGRLELADIGSTNGTLIGQRLIKGARGNPPVWMPLESPAVVKIDSVSHTLDQHVEMLVSLDQALGVRRVRLDRQKECTIGRDEACTICLPQVSISRIHAVIRYSRHKWLLEDRHSKNGLTLNSTPIFGATELHEHDVIRICREILIFIEEDAATQLETTICAQQSSSEGWSGYHLITVNAFRHRLILFNGFMRFRMKQYMYIWRDKY